MVQFLLSWSIQIYGHIKDAGVISDARDTGRFLVIDLQAMEGITLNYGEDYEQVKNADSVPNDLTDLYIINETSHNIFYVRGIKVKENGTERVYYTDYTSDQVDNTQVDLKYVEGVKIPDGFYYVGGTKKEGIVISDQPGDDMDNKDGAGGNQFVWVPVEDFDEFKREHFGTNAQKWWTGTFVNNSPSANNLYEPNQNDISGTTKETADEVVAMYKSVEQNKGFYIARFEAGIDSETERTSSSGITDAVVSKKNKNVYNYIGWNNDGTTTSETGGAVEKARGMYTDKSTYGVTSTLCYGVQWDAVMRWISKDYTLKSYPTDSTGKGNYSGSLMRTGSNEDYQMKNIYDMAGNETEWTMEAYDTSNRVARGGFFWSSSASNFPVSHRGNTYSSASGDFVGFRVALYLPTILPTTADTEPFLPEGAEVTNDDLDTGITIKDSNGNEWTWVEVPRSIYNNSAYYTNGASKPEDKNDHDNIEKIMQNYAIDYRDSGFEDEFYSTEQHGFADTEEYNNWKYRMLASVYENGGFYIGKYEVGYELAEGESVRSYGSDYSTEHPTTQIPVIKQNAYPYNWVRCSQAQTLSKSLATGGKTSSLMFGIQWDLVLKYLEVKGNWDTTTNTASYYLKSNSGTWGNYRNVSFDITNTNARYSEDSGATFNVITGTYTKPSSSRSLTTGATERNSMLNIYDLAGSIWEWTLEYTSYSSSPCARRGGSYTGDSYSFTSSYSDGTSTTNSYSIVGFRPSLY